MATSTKPARPKAPRPALDLRVPDGSFTLQDDEPDATDQALADAAERTLEALAIPLDDIVRSPHNTRRTFPQESLDDLAASMRSVGQTTVCEVLPAMGGKYELVDGERRFRAALLAGLQTLRCVVRDVGHGSAIEIDLVRFEANRHREDLNPIDEALAFERFLTPTTEGGHGLSQAELAKRVGVSASQISNRVRLLRLPEKFQAALISAEMPVEVARMLAAWSDVPSVAKALERTKPSECEDVYDARRVIKGATFSLGGIDQKVIDKHRDALLPRELTDGAYSIVLATGDLELAKRLSEEQQAKNVAKWNKQEERAGRGKKKVSAEEAEKRNAQTYNKKLYRYVAEWNKAALLKSLETSKEFGAQFLVRSLLFFATRRDGAWERAGDVDTALGMKNRSQSHFDPALVRRLPHFEPTKHLPPLLRDWFDVQFDSLSSPVKPWELIEFAHQAGIRIETQWRLDDAFIGLHNAGQLVDLWTELGLEKDTKTSIPAGANRSFIVAQFVAAIAKQPEKKRPFPKCLRNVQPVSLT